MPAGTLTLTNNSTVVKGTGTAFNTELKAGDFIVGVVGGVTYTLPVKTVDRATQVTLIKAYDGPTQAGVAWYAVPREMQNSVTAQLVSEATKAMRGMNYDKQNWQQFFTADGDVTITLPDNSQSAGPSAKKLINSVVDKADKTEVDKKANKSDLGDSASRDVGKTPGTVAAGDDNRLNTVNNKSGGTLNSPLTVSGNISTIDEGKFISLSGRVQSFTAVGNGYLEVRIDDNPYAIDFRASDKKIKSEIKYEIKSPLDVARKIKPVSFKYKEETIFNGLSVPFGVIAQDLQEIFPESVIKPDGGFMQLSTSVLLPFLLCCVKKLTDEIDSLKEEIKKVNEL